MPPSYALHWEALGAALGFEKYQLERISADNAHSHDRTMNCFRSMLLQWLHVKPTWGKMDDAISCIKSGEIPTDSKGVLGAIHPQIHILSKLFMIFLVMNYCFPSMDCQALRLLFLLNGWPQVCLYARKKSAQKFCSV